MRCSCSGTDWTRSPHSLVSYGAKAVIVADDPALAEPLADRYASVIAEVMRQQDAKTLLGSSSTFSKDILPRVAALLDAPMVTDVIAIEKVDGAIAYRRPINAGSMLATVRWKATGCVLTARATAFAAPARGRRAVSRRTIRIRRRIFA